jgi:hypothetical protein
MLKVALGLMVLFTQLTAPPGNGLPQILHPNYKGTATAGKKAEVTLSFNLLNGFAINRTPPITLKLTAVPGLTLEKSDFVTAPEDPKSQDEYYVDLPTIKVPVTAAKAGKYEVPGKLTYFFCSKADGFCSRQVIDVRVPVTVQ